MKPVSFVLTVAICISASIACAGVGSGVQPNGGSAREDVYQSSVYENSSGFSNVSRRQGEVNRQCKATELNRDSYCSESECQLPQSPKEERLSRR